MKYFLLRQAPKQRKITTVTAACKWDVVGIMKSETDVLISNLLYRHEELGVVFLTETTKDNYDLMDALDLPQCIPHEKLQVLQEQEIYDHNDEVIKGIVVIHLPDEPS